MTTRKNRVLALVLAAGLVTLPMAGSAGSIASQGYDYDEGPSGGHMFLDAVVVRPLTLLMSAAGAVTWVVTLPFTIPADSAGEAGRAWVAGPLKYTFMRPLGEMEEGVEPAYVQESSSL
ncbi:MAG TPA: hypothetical protein ENI96_00600 [Sedimenticola thiotaurini]|uniref:Multidrug transporter n=1 Tax=Sedimenticola thiotaurini TaxID=1543721 RepID=A0A831W650_9GAMM|nr:hypothetical protein [Sedimenticola thiotaurini]